MTLRDMSDRMIRIARGRQLVSTLNTTPREAVSFVYEQNVLRIGVHRRSVAFFCIPVLTFLEIQQPLPS